MKTKTIKQFVVIKASPEEVYDALMDSQKHTKFTGSKAVIGKKVGEEFSAYEGGLSGKNVELVKGKKIVQLWFCSMEHWPKGHYSKVTFSLEKVKGGTKIDFTHEEVPQSSYKDIEQGWEEHYWKKLKKYFER